MALKPRRVRITEEPKMIEKALESCRSLHESLKNAVCVVRRLNLRYNTDWMLVNYKIYLADIFDQYRCELDEDPLLETHISLPPNSAESQSDMEDLPMPPLCARKSQELIFSNQLVNCRFIKIQRSMEGVMIHVLRAIEISNRQKNFIHMNWNEGKTQGRICHH